jgi:tRNA nucleotidyltransferase (CCA-adding enzyme)
MTRSYETGHSGVMQARNNDAMTGPMRRDLLVALGTLRNGRLLLEALPPGLAPAVHLVGGAVRDLLLGGAPADLDLLAEGSAASVAAALGGRIRSYDRFGTVTVTLDGASFDIASARREHYPSPGALPEVEPAELDEDLIRRDFTVNAIALALTGPERGRLHAAPGALDDLEHSVLRVLHDRSFDDDPTRLLRLARYQARLGFEIEPTTVTLAFVARDGGALATVSGPRIGNELRATAREADPIAAFASLRALALDDAVEPGFGITAGDATVATDALELLPIDGRPEVVVLAVAGRPLGPNRLRAMLERLAFEAGERDSIGAAASQSEALSRALSAARRPSEIAAAIDGAEVELVALAGALGAAAPARLWIEDLRGVSLKIDGHDLIAAGVAQGPAVGSGLRAALAAALDGEAGDRQRQLEVALRAAADTG